MSYRAGCVLLAMSLFLSTPAPAQDKPEGRVDFTALRDKRQEIHREIERAQSEIAAQRDRIGRMPVLPDLEAYLKNSQSRVQFLKKEQEPLRKTNPARASDLERDIQNETQRIGSLESDITIRKDADRRIAEQQEVLTKKQIELSSIESKIDDLLRRDVVTQDFKRIVSLMFAALVLAVIVGFFWLAFADKRVRRTIFAGEAGIQFITLFSLVIAIILFGITGILGDKELSALLGGLSGYILGRSMHTRGTNGGATATAQPNNANAGQPGSGAASPGTGTVTASPTGASSATGAASTP